LSNRNSASSAERTALGLISKENARSGGVSLMECEWSQEVHTSHGTCVLLLLLLSILHSVVDRLPHPHSPPPSCTRKPMANLEIGSRERERKDEQDEEVTGRIKDSCGTVGRRGKCPAMWQARLCASGSCPLTDRRDGSHAAGNRVVW